MKALEMVWNFSAFPDIVEALVVRTGLSLSKESCRARLHQKTEILARVLVHPSTEKILAPVSTIIASFLNGMLPHLLPLRLLLFSHRGSFICFQIIYPLSASVGTFSSPLTLGSSGQPAARLRSALILTCLHKNFHLQPLKPRIMQDSEYTYSPKNISGLPLCLNHSEIQ